MAVMAKRVVARPARAENCMLLVEGLRIAGVLSAHVTILRTQIRDVLDWEKSCCWYEDL